MAKKNEKDKQVEQTLELVRKHLLDMIAHPEKLDQIPDHGTLILYPVPVEPRKAA